MGGGLAGKGRIGRKRMGTRDRMGEHTPHVGIAEAAESQAVWATTAEAKKAETPTKVAANFMLLLLFGRKKVAYDQMYACRYSILVVGGVESKTVAVVFIFRLTKVSSPRA